MLVLALLVVSGSVIAIHKAESKRPTDISFGKEQSVNVFPGAVETTDWKNAENALNQDLSENALYQMHSKHNSAYVMNASDMNSDEHAGGTQSEPNIDTNNTDSGAVSDEPTAPAEEPLTEPSPDPEVPPEALPEPVSMRTNELQYVWGVFKPTQKLFPFAQLTLTSSTVDTVEDLSAEELIPTDEGVTEQSSTSTTTQEIVEQAPVVESGPVHDITLTKFDTAPLEPGQLIQGIQLRLSFGAKLKHPATETAPYVDVLYGTDASLVSVGQILLDDEVSNAINGGYFLFALPDIASVTELAGAKVVLRYHGDTDILEGMYLDTAWLEMSTKIVTKQDLLDRGLAEQLKQLEEPKLGVLLSDQLNFTREENPVFNLRYESKQNFLLRGLMKLLGRSHLSIDAISVNHESVGGIPVVPNITVTKDGLVTIEIKPEDAKKLPPGVYQINLQYNENGYKYTDTFDFEWGILSINPNKTEYEIGETAKISIGALSPNGNTLCDANLDLYIIDPAEFVTKVPVTPSGKCNGNNVIDVPDFTAEVPAAATGVYEMYMERLDETGAVIGFTTDTFRVVENQNISIERKGPTRIYPRASYPMELTVASAASFDGKLHERVPASFVISSTSAEITQDGDWQILTWDISIAGEGSQTVSYGFDAPDISPYLYNLGEASLEGKVQVVKNVTREVVTDVASDAASSTDTNTASTTDVLPNEVATSTVTEQVMATEDGTVFVEHRKWQIASDATGSLLVMWAGANIPSGWTCVSCTGGDVFYQRFIVGSSTAGNNGGAATHTHTATGAVVATTNTVVQGTGGAASYASAAHTHIYAPTIGTANNLPSYRNLVIIQFNSAGEPTSIPTGVISVFDATVAAGWTRYSAQDGFYPRGESAANRGTTAGSNTHTHTITGTALASAGTVANNTGGAVAVANAGHTHAVSSNTAAENIEPPNIQVILGQLNATSTMPNSVIGMWTDTPPTDWNTVSGASGAFENRFFKGAATYGTTGGANTHTPANVVAGTTATALTTNRAGAAGNTLTTGAHAHVVNVTAFTSSSIVPTYRSVIFGKRAGGQPPVAPVITNLFDSEKTGTSTPSFNFNATDSVGTDSLIYEFQWDDNSDFSSPTGDRTSDVETGCSPNCFVNTVTGADTSPFNETENIKFTIQTALTNNATYYWRVRAKKSTGSTYGPWSTARSLTYVIETSPSQWMQTKDAQFLNNTFSSTETYGSDSVRIVQNVPTEALVVYGENAVQTPMYRIWNGTTWGSQLTAPTVGGIPQWIKTAAGTTRNEYVMVTQDDQSDVNTQVYNGTAGTWGNLTELTTIISDTTRRGMDVIYESQSGNAMVVYCDGDDDPSYKYWNGTSWSSAGTITTASANSCNYIALAADPVSNEIIMVTRDTGAGYEAQVWSGSAWGNSRTLGSMSDTAHEGISVKYEESGGQGMVVTSNGITNGFIWTSWSGIEWGTPTAYTLGDDFEWGVLKSDQGSDNMALCYIDNDDDIGVIRWNGDAWQTTFTEIETFGNSFDGRAVSCEFETTSGRDGYIMVPYSDTTNARYQFWNGSVYSAEASISTIQDAWEVGSVRAGDGKILSIFHDDTNTQYDFSYWNGTVWSTIQTLEANTSVAVTPFRQPLSIVAKTYQPASGSMKTSPIPFTTVAGQRTWGEVTWNATKPVGTSVLLQVMYATTTYCNILVPNGALAGNSTGFDVTATPLNISGLSTTTYSSLCLKATLSTTNANQPTLDDWTLSWVRKPYLVQSQFRWYDNANSITPSDIWPVGAVDLLQNDPIPQAYSPGSGSILRLRMDVRSDNAALSSSAKAFKLQFAQQNVSCGSSTAWYDVGAVGSTTAVWRGYNNLLAFDNSTISSLLLTGSDVGGSYEEENNSANNPNSISVGNEAEWDWVLQHNGATVGVQYCFRMVASTGIALDQYTVYPSLITNDSPDAPILSKLFDNEQVASTTPWFEFAAEDPEGQDISYQIQVDNDYDFSSTVLDRNSITNLSEFENIVVTSDRDAFTTGQTIQFKPTTALTNGTTYYWRVRGKDPDGSNAYGDWSTIRSFTVNTATTITTWYQTERKQFDTDDLLDTETTAFDDVVLTTGFTPGTTTGTTIDYDNKTTGNAWGSLSWNNNLTTGSIRYRIEYYNSGTWSLVPESYLPGNATGFNTSPVSLLGLDPLVHNEIRVQANLTNSGGSPRLLDWKIAWGYAVAQPTQISLFDNEKMGTTTPTFKFRTTDPELNDLQYEISWSTDNTFVSGTTTKRSGVATGFTNVTNGGDTSPFNSGDTIQFKIQTANALTNGNTYWWKVRARDPAGANVWSVWSPLRSFTVDTTVTVSTWFQTTDQQFTTDSLNNTEITGSNSVRITSVIREALVAYAEGTVQTPRYQIWNGATWGGEGSATSVGGTIRYVETAASQSRDEYIVATQEAAGRVRAQVYNGATVTWGNLNTIVAAVGGLTSRGYDIAYETTSGDALVVACSGTEATYSVWNGTSWSAATAITLAVTANCNWIELASDPTSDEIILVARDATTGATDYNALVWNGSAWGNSMTMGSMVETGDEGMSVEYEESGNQAVVVVSNGINASFSWNSWNGSAWSGVATQATVDDFENGRLARDLGTDNLALCSIHQNTEVQLVRWTGSSNTWNTAQTVELTGNAKTGHASDCIYETTAGRDGYIMIPYSDTTNARYQFYNGTILSSEASISTIQDSQEVQGVRTGDGNILGIFYDDTNTQYDFSYWNGTVWSTIQTLEGTSITTTAPPTIPISLAARKYPTFTSGTAVSSAIDFDDGSGLKWQTVTFSDTTPGASDILYHVQYWNGTGWVLIPNSALASNSTGFSTSPIDISNVSRITYNTIRLKADLNCSGGNCPILNDWTVVWSAGINVSGTLKQYNQTASTTSGTVTVAVNGTLQSGKTATVSNGVWTIANVTAFEGDIVTVFVTGASNAAEAVGKTRYDGDGDITGMTMFERHLVIGSNDATTTAMTNSNLGLYDYTNTEDIFFNESGGTLSMCADSGCSDAKIYIKSGVYYTPGGRIVTHDFQNYGTFTAGSYTHEVNGSWDNNSTINMNGSTVVFAATSSTESINSSGANFNNVTLGTTTGSGIWTLGSTLDINGNFTVSRGTFARGTTAITIAGNLTNGSAGSWTGLGTTTLDGTVAATWNDQNGTLQNVGKLVVDGTSKAVTLAGNVKAQSITIGSNDTLDASASNYDITLYANWNNQNNFVARSGEVFFAATSSSKSITTSGSAFYDLTFSGTGGGWSFTESTISIGNDLRFSAGTVTLPTATTTIAGSLFTTSGTFGHNNGTMYFTSGSAETITFAGGAFTNVARNMTFEGAGSWTVSDTNATSTNDVIVKQGTLNFPTDVFAIGGRLADTGGAYVGGTGTVLFYAATSKVLTAGGSSFNNVTFAGAGSWSFSDSNVTTSRNVIVNQGTLTMPSGTFSIAGSYDNNATVTPGTGTVKFDSTDTGETVDFGSSALYNVLFDHTAGGWTINQNATTTNNFTLTNANSFTLSSGKSLSVGATFTNSVAGSATTWTGSTLALRAGTYSINTKVSSGDAYSTINVAASTKISMWNSFASTYTISSGGYLYSADHNAIDGDLYIFGNYTRSTGTEYWSYATDFDGTALGGSSRQVDIRFASGATAAFTGGSTLNVTGISSASTTVANQGSGTYTVTATGGTFTAQYYEFRDLGGAGLSLLGAVSVPTMQYGSFTVGAAAASAITLSSTTIDASPAKQLYNVRFATTTAIAAKNVSQTDGTPASFWWFRQGSGNLYGENYDNDTGNPGSVRFDDSSLVITVSGTVYSDAGVTPIAGGTCNGSTAVVKVVVSGGASYTGSCSNVNGTYSIPGVTFTGDPTLTVYLDNASGGQKGSAITRTPTANITNMNIYTNRVIVRNQDVDPLTITNLALYDSDNDSDLRFNANGNSLRVFAGNELFVFATSTFTPGGPITLAGNAGGNSYDGTLYINNGATFNAYATTTNTIGGRLVLASSASFSAASSTVVMNATTSGKSITASGALTFNNLTFNGSGGAWNLGVNITANGNIAVTAGTVTGTGNISLPYGSLSGNGILSLGAGTTTISRTNTLGGTSAWTFYNLQFGNGTVVGTTTPVFTSTTTIAGKLTIAAAHFLSAGSTKWDLSGTGNVFIENGTFIETTSTVRYSGAGANVRSTGYYNLDINSGAGSQTYTGIGLGITVGNNLTIGGTSNSTFNVTASDPALDVNGNVTVRSNGTLSASDTGVFTIAGSYDNDGTFTGNNGTVTFDGSGTTNIAAGNSSFSNVRVNSTGTVTVTENATSSTLFTLQNANTFTVSSGQILSVGGTFFSAKGGAATTWTASTLHLYGNGNYSINAGTTTDMYGTLSIDATTQIRAWNSDATTYDVDSTASLYSQDHANSNGHLYIWGSYRKSSGADHWSYNTDFDGTALGGSPRKVDVYFASGASATVSGGTLAVYGATTASTTLQNQGSGTYSVLVGGNASTSFKYYQVRNMNSTGLTFAGSPTIGTLSSGDIEVSQNGGTAMTVGGPVITNNPAKNFTRNRFALNGVGSGFNVTATGTSASSWRFVSHYGGRDGEAYDVDPDGDPGYTSWDNSAANITISGNVYSDEGSTVSTACNGVTQNVTLRMAGLTSSSTSCNAGTGAYTFTNIAYGTSDSLVVYLDGAAQKGATVTQDPVSNITGLHIYENRVIVRHESIGPLTISDMATWDSTNDADIPFAAVIGSPNTLTLPVNRKLIIWNSKTFAPNGNVTISGGGAGAAYDGSLQLFSSAVWTGAGTEALSVGGSMVLDTSAVFTTANGTTTFTTTGATRTIDLNSASLYHVAFAGSGSWSITDPIFTVNGNFSKSAGALTLPTATSTFNGSFLNNGGTFTANGGKARFTGTGGKTLKMGGSSLNTIIFAGGNYLMSDINATSTGSTTIQSGTITLPSGVFSVGRDFKNTGGAITHNTCDLALRSTVPATLLASSSNLYSIRFAGGGSFRMLDRNITFADDFLITNSSSVLLASGTISVGGSFAATGATFTNATTTILFNATASGKTINPGSNSFYSVQIGAPAGGYTLTGNATTTKNFTIASASSFAVQSGVTLKVLGVFTNSVGGSATTWTGSTLALNGSNGYSMNTKSVGGDQYNILNIGANSDIRMWNSAATTTTVNATASLYSQDHATVNGYLNIYGDFHIATTTEYWSYAKDFDGTSLTGSERLVTVRHSSGAVTTADGGNLQIVGASGNKTAITNQGSGTYAVNVSAGTFNALYYSFSNLNSSGLNLSGSPSITSLSYGDYTLAVNTGTLITVASSTINANASMVITGNSFATTSAITGKNVTLSGTTANAWTFSGHTGNLDGEDHDVDGATACGSIRWSDSTCLITQQTHYRWRNDDGGTDVQNSEWYNSSWNARKSVHIDNADATTYTSPVVQLFVTYDSDMQADFDDLRFTQDDGITPVPYWIGSSTNSTRAEVWVKVPSLTADDTATVYMYYNNPGATSSSSADNTFIAADDFEDGNITEYSGQTTLFTANNARPYDGTRSLDNSGNPTGRANTGGIYRLDQTVSRGETYRFWQYVDTSSGVSDDRCGKFAVQTPTTNNNYAVCFVQYGTDRISLVKNVTDTETSSTVLASSTVTYTTGWYEVQVKWSSSGNMAVSVYNAAHTLFTSMSATDSSYSSGGIGFTFWYHYGAWDAVSSRPTLTTEPTIRFGAEQGDGGATWKAALDTQATFNVGDIARLRIAIENSGTAITGQLMLLEYAAMGASPSCEAVSLSAYAAVPIQASCGSSPICMQATSYFTNGATIADLLAGSTGTFTAGQARENPSNITSAISIAQNYYTEIEYAITPTANTVDENLCFRISNNGTDYDTYLKVGRMSLQFNPTMATPSLNNGSNIALLPGITTRVYATGTVTDLNGYADLAHGTTTFYRSGVTGGAACAANNNDCYISNDAKCDFTGCSGNSCNLVCYADIYFHADPTDAVSTYSGQEWFAFMEVKDNSGGYDFDTAIGVDVSTLRAMNVNGAINYGSVAVSADTGSTNASTVVQNQGNVGINVEIGGSDMSDGASSRIPSTYQKFATSTFTYSSCTSCRQLSSTTPYALDVELNKPTVASPLVSDDVYWGIAVPYGIKNAPHQGLNVFTPVGP